MSKDPTFVRKLDVPAEFAQIPTGLKTLSALKKHEAERYSVWYNHFKELGQVSENKQQIGWVALIWKTIHKYIEDTYGDQEKYAGNTYRNHLEGLANVLLAIDKN